MLLNLHRWEKVLFVMFSLELSHVQREIRRRNAG